VSSAISTEISSPIETVTSIGTVPSSGSVGFCGVWRDERDGDGAAQVGAGCRCPVAATVGGAVDGLVTEVRDAGAGGGGGLFDVGDFAGCEGEKRWPWRHQASLTSMVTRAPRL